MDTDEKWPFMVHEGKEYAMGPDNGCFYRWCSMALGVCEGDVIWQDRFNNKFCHKHKPEGLSRKVNSPN